MPAKNLSVYLNETFVGVLNQFPDGRTFLAFGDHYLNDTNRPILSLSLKNTLYDLQAKAKGSYPTPSVLSPSGKLPPFFSHLLPEGKLRTYLARAANVRETQEFLLLSQLKDDLPGAVKLGLGTDNSPDVQTANKEDEHTGMAADDKRLRFSLAGIQLKFSGNLVDSRIVIPAHGIGGHWIIKFPTPMYPHLIELEYSMLMLARGIGIAVPEFRLVSSTDIENLPHNLPETIKGSCLISKRFDRIVDGGRIHMEDFAQVFAIYDKYDKTYNYQSIANVLWLEIGLDAVLEFVRRLVHMIITGNADMHLKNWSLIYPNGLQAELSPAYDFVSTIVYQDIDRTLPHKIAGERNFSSINMETFRTFAQIAKLPERAIVQTTIETIDAIKDCWPRIQSDLPIPDSYKKLIEAHMQSVPLFSLTKRA